ncbi:hypothetical protein AAHA92_29684 [Salvia divinorum]|uniref:Uncharacterized protein n=1 Tax=Salvia divinorum TaxID=28513 RepID=A0ABD1G221_SALDI
MRSLQLSNFRGSERSELSAAGLSPAAREPRRSTVSVIRSSFWGGSLEYMCDADMRARRRRMPVWRSSRVFPAPVCPFAPERGYCCVIENDYGGGYSEEGRSLCILLLEKPFDTFPIHQLYHMHRTDILFSQGRVAVASWNKSTRASNLQD